MLHFYRPVVGAAGLLLFVAAGVRGATYDELVAENATLHARIVALEVRLNDDEHDHGNSHGHACNPSNRHGDTNPHSHCGSHKRCCEDHGPHFDYCNAYESHAEQEGCCCNGNGHSHGNGHGGHGHEHEHGPAYHHSVEGYPLVHGIRTEIDFIERSLEFQIADTRGADDGQVDELEFELELVYAISDRVVLIVGQPYIFLDPINDADTSGFGDLELGFRFLAFNGERDGVFFGLNMSVPTGDEDRDLGAGNTVLEPTALWAHDFGGGTYLQSVVAWEVPVDVNDPTNDLRYDTGLFHTFTGTEDALVFKYLTAIFEVNGATTLNGPDADRTVIDLTAGVRWIVREEDEVGIGWSFPVSGDQNFDSQLLISYFRHF